MKDIKSIEELKVKRLLLSLFQIDLFIKGVIIKFITLSGRYDFSWINLYVGRKSYIIEI